jgi:hypothetical protein
MATTRVGLASDSTWARAWEVDDSAGRIALLDLYAVPLGPKRGDIIIQLDTNVVYLVVNQNLAVAVKPIDLTSDVTGILPAANLPPSFDWQDVPFNAANFTASGAMTLTVIGANVTVNRHALSYDGLTAIWNFSLFGFTVGGTPDFYLRIAFPFGAVPNSYFLGALGYCHDNVIPQVGFGWVAAGGQTYVEIGLVAGTTWPNSAANAEIDFTITYEVQP